MTVVSDTSALTNLIKIDQLEMLKAVFGKIIILDVLYKLNEL